MLGKRRWMRWVVRGALALVVLAMVVVGAAVWAVRSNWGQERIRRAAQAALQERVDGEVSIGSATVELSGRAVLTEVRFADRFGQDAITARRIEVHCSLWPLLSGRVRCERLIVDNPVVYEQRLGGLFLPGDPEGAPPDVRIARLELVDGVYVREVERFESVAGSATLRLDGQGTELVVGGLTAHWVQQARAVQLAGRLVSREADGLVGSEFTVASAGTELRAKLLADERYELVGTVVASDIPVQGWLQDVQVRVAAEHTDRWEIQAGLMAGAAGVDLQLRVDPDQLSLVGTAEVRELAPAELVEGAPPGRVSATITTLEVAGRDLRSLQASVTGSLVGRLQAVELQELAFSVSAREGRVTGRVSVTTARGNGKVSGVARLEPDDRWFVEQLELRGDGRALLAFVPGASAERLLVDAAASGYLEALEVSGGVQASGARFQEHSFVSMRGRVDVQGVPVLAVAGGAPPQLAGKLSVRATGLQSGATEVSSVELRGDFRDTGRRLRLDGELHGVAGFVDRSAIGVDLRFEHGRTRADFRRYLFITQGIRWSGEGGRVTLHRNGRLDVAGIALASVAGRVAVSGRLESATARRAQGVLRVEVERLDLRRLAPVHRARLAGVVGGELRVSRRGRSFGLDGKVSASGLRWSTRAPALSGTAQVALGEGRFTATAELAHAAAPGRARISLDSAAPRDTLDVEAWRRIGLPALRQAVVQVTDLELAVLERYSGRPVPVQGRVNLLLQFPFEGERSIGITADVAGLRAEPVDRIDLRLRGVWGRRLSGRVEVDHAGAVVTSATIALGVGLTELVERGAVALQAAPLAIDIPLLELDLRRLRRAGITREQVRGTVSGTVRLRGTAERYRVELADGRAVGVRVAGVEVKLVELSGSYQEQQIAWKIAGTQRSGGLLAAQGKYRLPSREVGAQLTAQRFDLALLRAFATDDESPLAELGGTLDTDGHVLISGTLDAPVLTGSVTIAKGQLLLEQGSRRVHDVEAKVSFSHDRILLDRLDARTGDGRILATGVGSLNQLAVTKFVLNVEARDFPLAVGGYVATIGLAGAVTGELRGDTWALDIPIRAGKIVLSDTGSELQGIGALEDVVFVDAAARAAQRAAPDADDTRVEIHAYTYRAQKIRLRSPELRAVAVGTVDLLLVGGSITRLNGQLRVPQGRVELLEREYEITQAVINLDGQMPPDPGLSIAISRTFPAATVVVRVLGTASAPEVVFESDPAYGDTEILAIMLGEDPNDPELASRPPEDRVAGIATNLIARRMGEELGIPLDVIRLHDDGIELGKWIKLAGRRVLIGYRSHDEPDATESANEGTFEIPLFRGVTIEGRVGDRGVVGSDMVWTLRF